MTILDDTMIFYTTQIQVNNIMIELLIAEDERINSRLEQIDEEDNVVLTALAHQYLKFESISFECIANIAMQSSLAMRIVYQDIFYEIFRASPIFMTAVPVRRPRQRTYQTYTWWTVRHPSLNDNINTPENNRFKTHYRITLAAFERLVNVLSLCPEYVVSASRGGYPTEVQVAVVLWRFANGLFGFRLLKNMLGITDGSVNKFTNRFVKAMTRIAPQFINWPFNDSERATAIAQGFESLGGPQSRRLPRVIGAMDGKLVVIQKPKEHGNRFVDRKNNASLLLLAVCDYQKRFTYVRTGESGTYYTILIGDVISAVFCRTRTRCTSIYVQCIISELDQHARKHVHGRYIHHRRLVDLKM